MYIIHIDGDSFFVSCELLGKPDLSGLPVVTGGERGVATSMNKEAKALGVSRGMPSFMIRKQFPQVKIISSNFDLYRSIARRMYAIVRRYSDCVEEYSIDECFAIIDSFDEAFKIKSDLENELGLTFGIGVSQTKTLSKIASRYAKPGGIRFLEIPDEFGSNKLKFKPKPVINPSNGQLNPSLNPSDPSNPPLILDYKRALNDMHIGGVWGIGRQTSAMLSRDGILTPLQFASLDEHFVMSAFDKPLREKWQELNGVVKDFVGGEATHFITGYSKSHNQKSISSTRTFEKPSNDYQFLLNQLAIHLNDVCKRARELGLVALGCSFFLKRQDFSYLSGNFSLNFSSAIPGVFMKIIRTQFFELIRKDKKKIPFRTAGCTIFNFLPKEESQNDLFGEFKLNKKLEDLWSMVDEINRKYDAFKDYPTIRPASASIDCSREIPRFSLPHLGFVK